ncbi:MAG: AgmX/PglI C-terminal domain-containing protein [Polyangia bacterium]|jgi:hypothetical protein|nr:AgmX/PglI C-terminal domain-containing protein [Polyangia bacterium]
MKPRISIAALALLFASTTGCSTLAPSFKTDLTSTMAGAKTQLSDCYRQALVRNPKLSGTMALSMTVERNSTAISAVSVLERPGEDAALDQCIIQVTSGLNVSNAPKVKVTAEYPLTLSPAAQ